MFCVLLFVFLCWPLVILLSHVLGGSFWCPFLDLAGDLVSDPGDFTLHSGLSTRSAEASVGGLQPKDQFEVV